MLWNYKITSKYCQKLPYLLYKAKRGFCQIRKKWDSVYKLQVKESHPFSYKNECNLHNLILFTVPYINTIFSNFSFEIKKIVGDLLFASKVNE